MTGDPPRPGNLRRMFGALVQAGRVLSGRQIAGRGLTVYPDDIFLVSYPRSGNTWMRFLLGNLVNQKAPVMFSNIEFRIPEIYFNRDRLLRRLPRPRMLKSHECFQPHYPRVIYIVRDPRDVAVSFYHHNVKARNIPESYPLEKFVPQFIAGEFDRRFGSWRDHVLSWTAARGDRPEFMMVRYEEMQSNTLATLHRITEFLERCHFGQIDSRPAAMQRAIELSSPERMRLLEKREAGGWVLTKKTRSDKPFVRTAMSGGWTSQLSRKSVEAIESAWGNLMRSLGYELISLPNSSRGQPVSARGMHL